MTPKRMTAEAERVATESGAFSDKVRALDPAAAPLGTDDEAAGQPSGGDARASGPRPAGRMAEIRAGPAPSGREWWVMVPILAVLACVGIGWLWMN